VSNRPSLSFETVPTSRGEASPVNVTLNEILALVGRLDDAPGFDTPRERFRRFLFERVTHADIARSLIEQSQHSLGEQHRRALQDAIVMLGRFLGFETTFGTYQRVAGAVKYDGQWRSRHRLEIVLEIRADQSPRADLEELSRSVQALSAPTHIESEVRHLGLCVVTPLYGGRARLEDALLGEKPQPDLRITSVHSLLWLASSVSAGNLRHEDVLQLLTSGGSLDLVVDLMERVGTGGREETSTHAPAPTQVLFPSPALHTEAAYWLATIERDETTTPEQFVEAVIRRRQLLGVTDSGPSHMKARAGDWICFSLPGKGIVGHARVHSLTDGTALIRDAHRFSSVFTLKNVEIYETPVALGLATGQSRMGDRMTGEGGGPLLASVSYEEFAELTAGALEGG
jgi:hypothetical protein